MLNYDAYIIIVVAILLTAQAMASSQSGKPQRRGAFNFADPDVAEAEPATTHISPPR